MEGGFYERLIGSVKRSLRKSIGFMKLNRYEFVTILTETEAVINSRPLLYIGDDINSNYGLTPAHFISLNFRNGFPDWESNVNCPERIQLQRY